MQKRFFLAPAAIVVFILFFTVFGDRGLLRIHHLNRDRDEMQQHLSELKGENDKLKREIAALQSDKRYLESIARRDFGLVRSNETIYQFPSQDKPQQKAQTQVQPPPHQESAGAKPQGNHQAPPRGGTHGGAKAGAAAPQHKVVQAEKH